VNDPLPGYDLGVPLLHWSTRWSSQLTPKKEPTTSGTFHNSDRTARPRTKRNPPGLKRST